MKKHIRSPFLSVLTWANLGHSMLYMSVIALAVGVIYTKHVSRTLHATVQKMAAERDALHVEWGQLLLEHATWASDSRVEKIATRQLGMIYPENKQIVVITP